MDADPLIRRLKRRDEAAFTELVLAYQTRIYNLCYRMLGNTAEAEDVAQDVFVRAFQAMEAFRGDSSLSTWLFRIAINLCKNRLKYLGRRSYDTTAALDDVPESVLHEGGRTVGEPIARPDVQLEASRAERRVQRALAMMPEEFRTLLVLRDIEGLSYAEVADVTGLADGTVKSRLHRARAALLKAYEGLGDE